MVDNQTKFAVIDYLKRNPKGKTPWYVVGQKFGITGDQARYIWNTYVDTPTEEELSRQDFAITSDPSIKIKESIPEGYRMLPSGTVYKDGTIGYELVKVEENFEDVVRRALGEDRAMPNPDYLYRENEVHLLWSDVHIGMSTEGTIFNQEWAEEQLYQRINKMVQYVDDNRNVVINMTGDYIDGEDGYTASRTHKLQQNLNDVEMFEVGVKAFKYLIESCRSRSIGKVTVNFVENCNHNKYADGKIAAALEIFYEDVEDVTINRFKDFINHITTDYYTLILTHGKDNKLRKYGLGLPLKPRDMDVINNYIEHHSLEGPIFLIRGDLHQASQRVYRKFVDIMCPSFAYGSGWVATNFGNDYPGGFGVLEIIDGKPMVYFHTF